jgi:hypothetical protein
MNIGKPRKLTVPQKVSCDFAAAANITDIPENPIENNITIAMIGPIINKFGIVTPIAIAIPKMRLACIAATRDIANIFPSAIDDLEIGEVSAWFINPYLLSHKVFTPPKMLVKIAVSIIIPGAMNSIYSPSKPTD